MGTLEVESGQGDHVQILAAEDFDYALSEDENPILVLPGTGFVYSPVTRGADAGFAYVLIEGKAVGKIPVIYGETVEKEPEEEPNFFQKFFGRKEN